MRAIRRFHLVLLCIIVALPFSVAEAARCIPASPKAQGPFFQKQGTAKYVFLFIGDGMSVPQRSAADYYRAAVSDNENGEIFVDKMWMSMMPVQGMMSSHSLDSVITDSAAAGTAMATGHKTTNAVIGMDSYKHSKFKTVAEIAKEKGFRVGIVTSVSLDHATPACFYAHEPSRHNYYNIAKQMVESDVDYFGGGYLLGNLPKYRDGKPDLIEMAKRKGWNVVSDRKGVHALLKETSAKPEVSGEEKEEEGEKDEEDLSKHLPPKVIAYADYDGQAAMHYRIDQKPGEVTLAQFTRLGIRLLDNPKGFFFMIEGGRIDWACHANDAATTIKEVLDLDDAVEEAIEFYKKHPDETLIIVTGDHETGGLSIGFAGTKYRSVPSMVASQKMSGERFNRVVEQWREKKISFEEALPDIEHYFGLSKLSQDEKRQLREAFEQSMLHWKARKKDDRFYELYGGNEPIAVKSTHILARRAGLSWTTWAHTGLPVLTSALGVGEEKFGGSYDNTQLFSKILSAMGI